MARATVVGAALSLAVAQAALLAVQTPTELVRLAQSLLGTGVPVALVVEREDLKRTAGGELHNTDPGGALERLELEGGAWEVSREPVVRITRRERPREVDEVLAKPVPTDGQPLSIGRAIFIVPRLALNGELHGVLGGGVPSEACQLEREIRTDNRVQTLRQFLDAVVLQAPGIGWVLAWDPASPRETLSLGVVCADGSWSLLGLYPSPSAAVEAWGR
jgi:hypothetical protein